MQDAEWIVVVDECLTVRFYWDEVQNNRHSFVSDSRKVYDSAFYISKNYSYVWRTYVFAKDFVDEITWADLN